MNVLHLSSERTWRGGEQQIAYLIKASKDLGVNCFIACRKGSDFENYCIKAELDYIALPFSGQMDFYTASQIKAFCKSMDIDLIHAHSSHSHAMVILSYLFGNKTPLILSRRVDFAIRKSWYSRFKYNHKKIKKIICVSSAIKHVIEPDIKDKNLLTVVHSGVDINKFNKEKSSRLREEFNIEQATKIVANVAAIAPHKDYYTFVDAVELLAKEGLNVIFLIIGNGPDEDDIKQYIAQKNLSQHIIMTGFRDDLNFIFNEIDVFLITSKTEGLGTSIIDAFANKIPVVATKAGGIPELVKHEDTGLLANPGDSFTLAEHVKLLLKDDTVKASLIKHASEHLQGFTYQETARKTVKVYKSVLE